MKIKREQKEDQDVLNCMYVCVLDCVCVKLCVY